jgi:hypothetical protein
MTRCHALQNRFILATLRRMFRPLRTHALLLALVTACGARSIGPAETPSVASISKFTDTGSYDEAVATCKQIAAHDPNSARCINFGTTTQGRPMVALVVSGDGTLTASSTAQRSRPVIIIQAGIHAGEIEGKDAGFEFFQDMLHPALQSAVARSTSGGTLPRNALTAATFIFIPVLNPDGHERRSPNNRPNQRGPKDMGFRTTGVNLNLNRDYMKADSVEIQAELALFTQWHPLMLVDLHTTDGAKFEHDIAVLVAPSVPRPDAMTAAAKKISDGLQVRLTALGHLPLWFYPSFREQDHPESGVEAGDPPPRFSNGYAAERNMFGILVETHSWRSYRERVTATYDMLAALAEQVATDAPLWRDAQHNAEHQDLSATSITLLHQVTDVSTPFAFRGYKISHEPSTISGSTWTHYDESTPEVWTIPVFAELRPAINVIAPAAGYYIDGGFASIVAPMLRAHGITFVAASPSSLVAVQTFRADTVKFADKNFEARQRLTVTGSWHNESRTLRAGAIWIPIHQANARLIVGLCEPTAPDALVSWGLFNAAFEQKEYMEDYVAEQVARDMLTADPNLRAEFEAKIASDAVFAKDSSARLDFFRRRHASWDNNFNLVPVYRADVPMVVGSGKSQ